MYRVRAVVVVVVLAFVGGCGTAPVEPGTPTFEGMPRLTLSSDAGRFSVGVWTWPDPLAKGVAALRYRVVDAAGLPVDGATVVVTPWMPAHGHGNSTHPTVTTSGDGSYEIDEVSFYMSGRWELRSEITDTTGVSDSFVATLDVP
jgi:hypothetical protein